MPYVEITGIRRRYRGDFELSDISIRLDKGEIYTLMGPSGSGKTSLLRNISGLDTPDAGSVSVAGRDVSGIPATGRGIGMIFQDLALFPHMTAFENIAYGLHSLRWSREAIDAKVRELTDMLDITSLLQRYPSQISGGQRQRVALARSVAPSPSLLLLDEPLSSLDQQLRADVRSELKAFARKLGLTMIYVTHDHREGLYMADRAGIIFDGVLEREGSPVELFMDPGSERVARFLGYNVISHKGGRGAFYPSDFEFSAANARFTGTVVSVGFEGEIYRMQVKLDTGERVHLTSGIKEGGKAQAPGDRVGINITRMVDIR